MARHPPTKLPGIVEVRVSRRFPGPGRKGDVKLGIGLGRGRTLGKEIFRGHAAVLGAGRERASDRARTVGPPVREGVEWDRISNRPGKRLGHRLTSAPNPLVRRGACHPRRRRGYSSTVFSETCPPGRRRSVGGSAVLPVLV